MTEVYTHYTKLYGKPSRDAHFRSPDGRSVEIFKWESGQTDEGVTMYATAGVSQIMSGDIGCEYFLGLTPEADDIVEALAEVALNGRGDGCIPCSGDTIQLSYDLWKGTQMRSLMFTNGDEIIPVINSIKKRIIFLQLVPLFDSELEYKKNNGEKELWSFFESKQIPYWNSNRFNSK